MRIVMGALLGAACLATPALAEPGDLPADSAWQMVQRGDLVVLDVRTPTEWAMTGLPRDSHGTNLQDGDFLAQARGAVLGDLDQPVAVICRMLGVPVEDESTFSWAAGLVAQQMSEGADS